MDKDNNNSSNLQETLNSVPTPSAPAEMPAKNNDANAQVNNTDMSNVKSVFEDMNVSTQAAENNAKPQNMDNAPIAPTAQAPQQQPSVQIEIPDDNVNLGATTIGTIKPDKQKSPIAMLVLFGVLLSFILFMPEVLNYVNEKFGTNFDPHTGVVVNDEPIEDDEEDQKVVMYDLNDNTVITLDKITFQTFVKSIEDNEYKISFTAKNTGTQLYEFKKKVYLDFFDSSSTFIGRAYVENLEKLTGGASNNYKVVINKDIYDKAKKMELILRSDSDYPEVELVANQLTCTNEKYNIVYSFNSNKRLESIKDVYTYTNIGDVVVDSNNEISYNSKIKNLNELQGVTAVFKETDTGFMTTIYVDYSSANYEQLSSDKNYYKKDSYARVVKFEMSAKGYNCR